MMTRDFRIDGLKELDKALAEIGKKSTRTATMRRSLRKAAKPMADLAQQYAPVDEGDLEASIKIGTRVKNEAGRAAYSKAMREGGTREEAVTAMRDARRAAKAENPEVVLYMGPTTDALHGLFQEFGTVNHPPDPFMRPAFDREAQPTIDRLKPLLMSEIEKTVARIAKRGR